MKSLIDEFGTHFSYAKNKSGFTLKKEVITNPDISATINSDTV